MLCLKKKRCEGDKRSWCKGDTMLEQYPSITCCLKSNLLLGNQVHCLDFGDSPIGTNTDLPGLEESKT